MANLTVVIPVRNEEKNLQHCLQRLNGITEILVVDSGSSDKTLEIAQNSGAQILQFDWNGQYPKKRNWVLLNHEFQTDWVLFLDADEFVDRNFLDELNQAIEANQHDGFWLNYTNVFLGKELKHGLPQRKLACFRIGKALYERIDEHSWSKLDMEVHEHPIVDGSVGEITTPIEHNDFKGLKKFLERHINYAAWEANRYRDLHHREDTNSVQLTGRQKFKYKHLASWWYPGFYFLFTYIVKRGFLDGSAGFHYAFYKAWYFHTIRLMIREL